MIQTLRVENFALINRAELKFEKGFTVITGETGSGKSILLGALNLILGERANFSAIGSHKEKSIVEAEINLEGFEIRDFFNENELDFLETTIIRREITKQGRSRAFINDTPVGLSLLKEFSSRLIHIHSQHNTLELKKKSYQLWLLDSLSDSLVLRKSFEEKYNHFQQTRKALSEKEKELSELQKMLDYNAFQLEELESLRLNENNFDQLQNELQRAESAEDLNAIFSEIDYVIANENGLISNLTTLQSQMSRLKDFDVLKEISDRMTTISLELKDISETAVSQKDGLEIDDEKIQLLSGKLDEFNRLLFKHKVDSQQDLMQLMDSLSLSVTGTQSLEEEVSFLSKQLEKEESEVLVLAKKLHQKRKKDIQESQQLISKELENLKLGNTEIKFELNEIPLSSTGITEVMILFKANVGMGFTPIEKAASGGELSRVMLAIRRILSSKVQLPTILFDEIDTGVSGDVAQKVGNVLFGMGENMQVIAITHLPQVAAKGQSHWVVSKQEINGIMTSEIRVLSEDERVEETARLMSGEQINEAALHNAKELMKQ